MWSILNNTFYVRSCVGSVVNAFKKKLRTIESIFYWLICTAFQLSWQCGHCFRKKSYHRYLFFSDWIVRRCNFGCESFFLIADWVDVFYRTAVIYNFIHWSSKYFESFNFICKSWECVCNLLVADKKKVVTDLCLV